MDIIEKIGDTITEKGKVAADKAKELAAIANLKSQISTCEEVMKKNYLEIGKIYFEQYSDMPLRTAREPLQIYRKRSNS